MMSRGHGPSSETDNQRGVLTLTEIRQQPEVWPATLACVAAGNLKPVVQGRAAIICGAGTSAYAASAVAAGWTNALAIPTTDLLLYSKQEIARLAPGFAANGVLVSLARSGDSPESTGVTARIQKMFPGAMHLAITCNQNGQLAQLPRVRSIVLDPRTNDRSLAMTSSFSNLVLAGLGISEGKVLAEQLPHIVDRVKKALAGLEMAAQDLASRRPTRVMVLTSAGLTPLGREACLKVMELTAGRIAALPETFLGVRHGPMSFLCSDSLVLCVLSSDMDRRRYEEDLLRELKRKNLGHLIVVGPTTPANELAHVFVPAMAGDLPDYLRTPFEIVFPQLLAYYLSLASDLDPDNPSPNGVITRVVQRFQLHEGNDNS
jgi:tagatose-6-phosphate ketose/aldose isomerase